MTIEQDTTVTLRGVILRILREHTGMHEQFAEPIATAILDRLRDECVDGRLYVHARSTDERNARIRREFNGSNHDKLCRKHHISRRTLYRIIDAEMPTSGH